MFGLMFAVTAVLPFIIGTDFFPTVDAGLMKLHVRAPVGTRLEDTEQMLMQVESRIREIIPADEIDTINDMEGLPTSYNLAFVPTDNVGDMDAEVLIALKPLHHPTEGYMQKIREQLPRRVSRVELLFSIGRHCEPGAQLRRALAGRCSGGRSQPRPVVSDRPSVER